MPKAPTTFIGSLYRAAGPFIGPPKGGGLTLKFCGQERTRGAVVLGGNPFFWANFFPNEDIDSKKVALEMDRKNRNSKRKEPRKWTENGDMHALTVHFGNTSE